jgi:hypothetical protein
MPLKCDQMAPKALAQYSARPGTEFPRQGSAHNASEASLMLRTHLLACAMPEGVAV